MTAEGVTAFNFESAFQQREPGYVQRDSEWPLVLKTSLGGGLVVAGIVKWFFPEFNGLLAGPVKTTIEHGELLGLISFIGGSIIFFMPTDLTKR